MESGEYGAPPSPGLAMAESWQATLVLGVLTLILGIIGFTDGFAELRRGPDRDPHHLGIFHLVLGWSR